MSQWTGLSNLHNSISTSGGYLASNAYQPVELVDQYTFPSEIEEASEYSPASSIQEPPRRFGPPIAEVWTPISADTKPIQIWEGKVLNVEPGRKVMSVLLNAKIGDIARHTATIDLEWVSDQDRDLVIPGAVFYLTLYKRTKRGGSIENSQELRFRRLPSWTQKDLDRIEMDMEMLSSKIGTSPIAE